MVERLYTTFYDGLLYYCVSLARERAAAEDLVQETFLRAMIHLEDLQDLEERQQRAWLYQTAKHLYIDRVRKLAREECVEQERLDLSAFEEDLTKLAVGQLIGRLPEGERALFSMRYFQGYNAAELGNIFGLPPSTVRSRLSAARRHLAAMLAE